MPPIRPNRATRAFYHDAAASCKRRSAFARVWRAGVAKMQIFDPTLLQLLEASSVASETGAEQRLVRIAASLQEQHRNPGPNAPLLFSAAYEMVSRLDPDLVCEARVRCLALIAAYYQDNASPEASLAPAEAAVSYARQLGDDSWLGKAAKIRGVAFAYMGDFPSAVLSFTEALEAARRTGDVAQQSANWNNLGLAHLSVWQFADAMAMFEQAVEIAADAPSLAGQEHRALSNMALAALQAGDVRKGLRAVQQAISTMPAPQCAADYLHRVNAESHYVRLLLELNLVDQAREHMGLMRHYAAQTGLELAKVNSAFAEGLVEVASGMADIGFSRIKRTLEFVRKNLPYSLVDGLHAIVKAYELAGQPDAALVYLRELLRLKQDAADQLVSRYASRTKSRDVSIDREAATALLDRKQGLVGKLALQDMDASHVAMLEQHAVAAELHDDTTGEHCYRVGRLASLLAREYGVEEEVCGLIDLAARLHDIGKLTVPDAILLKPGKLTAEERAIMETHTTAGARILAKANVPQLFVAEEIARGHHERWDGGGYPAGLRGAGIPLAARITALADVFDALTHARPYKKAWSVEDSLREISSLRGKHFDPELTDLFLALVLRLQRAHRDLDAFLSVDAKNNPFIVNRAALARALKGEGGVGMHVEDPRR